MSYILDALKKSDQQRQLGATPTLQAAQLTVPAPKRPLFIYYGLLAIVLLVAGIAIGWLRPWQAEQPPPITEPVAAISPISISQQAAPAPLTAPPEMPVALKPNNPVLAISGTPGAAAPMPDKSMPDNFISGKPTSIAGVAQEQKAIPFGELPAQIQREIPAMTVQLHSYSSNPSERLVYINSTRLREGDSLMPGLSLEQVTPDGMIFSYKGYRFQRGIR
jgi:general secretion pathway protein B